MNQKNTSWDLTSKINEIAGRPKPWLTKVEDMAAVITATYGVDALWLMTLPPLKTAAVGFFRPANETSTEREKYIVLTDTAPPLAKSLQSGDDLISQVLNTNQPQFASQTHHPNLNLDQDLGDTFLQYFKVNIQAIIPIGLDTAKGVLLLGACCHKKTFDSRQQESLVQLGQHLFLTLQNAGLVEIANQQAHQLAVLNRIARTITSSLDLDEALQRTIAGIDEILDVEAGALVLADEERQDLYFKIILRGVKRIKTDFRLGFGQGIAGWVYLHQQPALVNDVSRDERFYPVIDHETGFKTRSALCTPLIVHGSPIGVLEVINKRQGQFNLDDLHLLISMTASLAIALKNSILFQQLQKQMTHMERLNRLAIDINADMSIAGTAQAVVLELSTSFSFEHAVLSLLDKSRFCIQHTLFNRQGEIITHLPPVLLNDSLFRQIVIIDSGYQQINIAELISKGEQQDFQKYQIQTLTSILLTTDSNEFGFFSLTNLPISDTADKHSQLLYQISPTLSSIFQKARLTEEMAQRATELEELHLLSERLLTKTRPAHILDTVLNYAPRLLSATIVGLLLQDGQNFIGGMHLPKNTDESLVALISEEMTTCLEQSLHRSSPIQITEMGKVYNHHPLPKSWQPSSKLTWPILTLRGPLGVIYLAYPEKEPITAERIRLFSLVVSRIAGAIENSRLFAEVGLEQARLSAVLNSTADGILVVSRTKQVILDNPAANQILKHAQSQTGKRLADITENQALLTLFERAEKTGSAAGEFTTLDDKTYYTVLAPVTVSNPDSKPNSIGWVASMRDITHFKELNESKDSFINTVSHDLRSPLSGISLATQLIEMTGELNERQHSFVRSINDHIESMTSLIDGLLDVGKIEAGIDMQMEKHKVSPIVQKAFEELKSQAIQKQLQFNIKVEATDAVVKCNALRLQQVFSNLMSNAIKYTPLEGSVNIKLQHQDDYLLFQVTDTGSGIPPADQPHIFEKFYRVRGEHMTGIKGSGLGLAITKSIIEKHNGRIWFDSHFNRGSTFSVLLPVEDSKPTTP